MSPLLQEDVEANRAKRDWSDLWYGLILASPPFLPPTHLYLHQTFPASTFWPLLSLLTSHTTLASHTFSVPAFLIGLPHPFSASTFPSEFPASGFLSDSCPFNQHRTFKPPEGYEFVNSLSKQARFTLICPSTLFLYSRWPEITCVHPDIFAVRTIWFYAQGNLMALSVIPVLPGLWQHCTVVLMEV